VIRLVERAPRSKPASQLGARLARERARQCKSMNDLARIAGIHASEISRLERGLRDRACRRSSGSREGSTCLWPCSWKDSAHPVRDRDPADTAARLGEEIRRERRALGMRQDDLALGAGLGLRAVHDIETRKATAQLETWVKALHALGLDLVVAPRERR
jgi:transcriptional regulator with XRE-family HTH domain